jgi:hypothetical protein
VRPLLAAVLGVVAAVACAAPAQASFTSDVSGATVTVKGDSAADYVTIGAQANFLSHSDLGPGYASPIDWNSDPAITEFVTRDFTYTVNLDAGPGYDIVAVGTPAVSAAELRAGWVLNGGAGDDALIIDASGDPVGRTVTVGGEIFTSTVKLSGNNVLFDADDFEGGLQIQTGDQKDTYNVQSVFPNRPVAVEAGGGDDDVNIGTAGGGLGALKGMVYVDGETGTDSLKLDDAASGGSTTYAFDATDYHRGEGDVRIFPTTEKASLLAGSGNDSIYKASSQPVSISSGAGDDLIASRDSAGDPIACGAGSDYVLTDALDTPDGSCEATDRVTPAPAGGTPTDGGSGDPQAPQEPQAPQADTTAPVATVTGIAKSIKAKKLLRGISARIATNEPASVDVQLVGSTSTARLARSYNLTLGQAKLPLGSGERAFKLKPNKRLVGKARRFTVRVLITATDASGNRSTVVRSVKVTK